MNKLLIDKASLSDPEALANCKVGDTKQLTVNCTVTKDDPTTFEADVTDIEYSDQPEPETTTPDDSGEVPVKAGPTRAAAAPVGGLSGY